MGTTATPLILTLSNPIGLIPKATLATPATPTATLVMTATPATPLATLATLATPATPTATLAMPAIPMATPPTIATPLTNMLACCNLPTTAMPATPMATLATPATIEAMYSTVPSNNDKHNIPTISKGLKAGSPANSRLDLY